MRLRFVVAFALVAGAAGCQHRRPPEFTVAPAARDVLVADILRELDEKYVSPEHAAQARPELARRWATDEFRAINRSRALCERVTRDLREVLGDKHLFLLPRKAVPAAALGPDRPLSADELAEQRTVAQKSHFGVQRVEVLDGNVGYVELVEFPPAQLPEVAAAVRETVQKLAGTRALILDLRDNHGGDGDTVALWMSHLLPRRTLLLTSWDRTTGKTIEDWTPEPAGPRYDRPVYVLTSRRTFSAGEELAYDVKTQKRGTLVGEATGGGANHNMLVPVGADFALSVSYSTTKSPVTGTNWEGVGVAPDIAVDPASALDTARARLR